MEHAVPQNITSFQFRLVGDMTLKQFGFLASGCVLAYLTFLILFSHSPVISLIIMFMFALAGVLFAFVPISDRPLNHWVVAFFKATYSPTLGSWKNPFVKVNKTQGTEPIFKDRLQNYLVSHNLEISAPHVISLPNLPTPAPVPQLMRIPTAVTPPPQLKSQLPILENQTIQGLTQEIQNLQNKISKTEEQLSILKMQQLDSQKIKQTSTQLQTLVNAEKSLAKQLPQLQSTTLVATITKKPQIAQQLVVLTSLPNVVNGIITDLSGNYLENVIVIIHNAADVPVRASKTNKLGQFTGATPLPEGEYNITFEKEGLSFETLSIKLNNEVFPALSIHPLKGNI